MEHFKRDNAFNFSPSGGGGRNFLTANGTSNFLSNVPASSAAVVVKREPAVGGFLSQQQQQQQQQQQFNFSPLGNFSAVANPSFNYLSGNDAATVEFKSGKFFVHSSVSAREDPATGTAKKKKDIILKTEDMVTLVAVLPEMLERCRQLQAEIDSVKNSGVPVPDSVWSSQVICVSEPKENKDRDGKQPVIFTTSLTLSTYEKVPYLWLKVFFDVEDKYQPGKKKTCCCQGGSLCGNADPAGLAAFVDRCVN